MTDLVSAHVTSVELRVFDEQSDSASLLVQAEVLTKAGEGAQSMERVVALDCGEWPLGMVGIDLSDSVSTFADGGRICFKLPADTGVDRRRLAYQFDWPREGNAHGDYVVIPASLPSFVLVKGSADVPLPDRVVVATPDAASTSFGLSRLAVRPGDDRAQAVDLYSLLNPRENFCSLGSIHGDLDLRASLRVLNTISTAGLQQVLANLAVAYEAVVQVLGGRARGELLLAAPDDLVHNKGIEYPAVLTIDQDSMTSDFNLTYELARQLVHLWFGGGCVVLGPNGRDAMAAMGAAVALHASSIFASPSQLTGALKLLLHRSASRSWYHKFRRSGAGGRDAAAELALQLFQQEAAAPGALRRALSRCWARAMLAATFADMVRNDESSRRQRES